MKETKGKKILMVCYYYPPLTDVGCKRSVAFSKYWKEAGWEPHVLSVKNPDKAYCSMGDDIAPEGVDVTYVYSLFSLYKFFGKLNGLLSRILKLIGIRHERNYFYDLFCVPDIFIGWIPLAILKGRKLVKDNNIDVIYVSCSPFSSGIIGWWIKKLTGKPLVIDYRDPYGLDISKYQKGHRPVWFRRLVDRWISGIVLKGCDLFTVTSEEIKQLYIEQFPFVKEKIHTAFNGFDHQYLDLIQNQKKYQKFTIIYTGNFYYEIEFNSFFEGLGLLKRSGEIDQNNFQFLFYGGDLERIRNCVEGNDVVDLVSVRERIPYGGILNEINRSHMQLLRLVQPMISTKLFEGIVLNIPFLATIQQGEVANIIQEYSPLSSVASDGKAKTVADCIEAALSNRGVIAGNRGINVLFLEKYSRESLAQDYLGVIENCYEMH